MAKAKKKETLSLEERLEQALVPVDEQPYEVPENWCWTKLKSITSHISDGSHNPPKDAGKGIPLLSATNIYDSQVNFSNVARYITEEEWIQENKRTKISIGDVLLTIVASIGRTALVESDMKFALQRSVAVIKPKCNSKYIKYFLDSPYIQKFMANNAKGTAQKGFYLKSVEELYISLPPLVEQQRIVEQIESLFAKLDEAKEKVQAIIDSKEVTVTSLLHKAFRGELTKFWRNVNSVSNDWKDTTIGELFTHSAGKALKKDNTDGSLYRYITTSNLYWGRFELTEVREMYYKENELEKCTATKGDLLICNGGDVGRAAIWEFDYDICLQNHVSRLRKKNNNVDVRFFYYYFMLAKRKGELIGTGIGISSLSAKSIASMNVKLPCIKEQAVIADILDKLIEEENNACTVAENIVERIELMKKAILAKAFRGELATNNSNEESAVELLKSILANE